MQLDPDLQKKQLKYQFSSMLILQKLMQFDTLKIVNINYATNDYLDQNRDLKIFNEEYAKEPLLNPIITYTDMGKFLSNSSQ